MASADGPAGSMTSARASPFADSRWRLVEIGQRLDVRLELIASYERHQHTQAPWILVIVGGQKRTGCRLEFIELRQGHDHAADHQSARPRALGEVGDHLLHAASCRWKKAA